MYNEQELHPTLRQMLRKNTTQKLWRYCIHRLEKSVCSVWLDLAGGVGWSKLPYMEFAFLKNFSGKGKFSAIFLKLNCSGFHFDILILLMFFQIQLYYPITPIFPIQSVRSLVWTRQIFAPRSCKRTLSGGALRLGSSSILYMVLPHLGHSICVLLLSGKSGSFKENSFPNSSLKAHRSST